MKTFPLAVAALAGLALSTHGAPPLPPAVRRVIRAQKDERHTGDACPRCHGLRVWVVDETLRCRDCGTRFLPPDLPPAEVTP